MENGSANLKKFYYCSRGCDNNGNYGPSATGDEWVIVPGVSYEDALAKLPPSAQVKVLNYCDEVRTEQDDDTLDIEDVLSLTCGWGAPFTFMDEENWADFSVS